MKKISLLTIFDVANFGTFLQALATAVTIQSFGAKVEILHYERPFKNTTLLKRNIIVRGMYYLYFWLRGLDGCLFLHRCRKFVAKYTQITRAYFSLEELRHNPPKADVYLTGSDQVWNTSHNQGLDEVFYLSFAPKDAKKVSYAASIGQNDIPDEYKDMTKKLLSNYDAISVRENSAVLILSELGLKAVQVLDPTLLLDKKQWLKYASKRLVKEDYLLVYSVEPKEFDNKVSEIARCIADELNLKIVSVSNYGKEKHILGCDFYYDFALPQDFLSLMAHASFVVASSFHGTAFAINFNRPFLTVTPSAFSSRIASLLTLTGLKGRQINDVEDINKDMIYENIDYEKVNSILEVDRKKSLDFIRTKIVNP